ncbi:MAG: helix-turn-helix transcriptional regulator [Deltaproteobacteria bacterium]
MAGRISIVVASLILEGLKKSAPDVLAAHAVDVNEVLAAGEEGAPLEPYRRILRDVHVSAGGAAILRAGESLRGLAHPLLFVLLNSDAPRILIEKEARLAAFFHSRHRVVIDEESPNALLLRHVSDHGAPEATDSLASCGQHIVLLEEIGCRPLRLRLPASDDPDRVVYDAGRFEEPASGATSTWHFEWGAFQPTRKPMAGLDAILLGSSPDRALDDELGPAARVEAVVRRDLGRTWKLAEVAEALGTSSRSLQRTLGAAGLKYSELLDRIRNEEAARLLSDSDLSITEIGYVCGFADTAHFSRSFKKRHEKTPSAFRSAR